MTIRKKNRKRKCKYSNKKQAYRRSKKPKKPNSDLLKADWDGTKSPEWNLKHLGLAANVNHKGGKFEVHRPKTKDQKFKQKSVLQRLTDAQENVKQIGCMMSRPDMEFCTLMIEKYTEDYEAMSRDYRNYWQKSPGQIRKMIKQYIKDYAVVPDHRKKAKAILAEKGKLPESAGDDSDEEMDTDGESDAESDDT